MDRERKKIVKELRERIADQFPVREIRVFGSSARGDNKKESDIDVWVCLAELNRETEEALFDIAYDMELKYDCLIDLIAVSEQDLNGKIGIAPIQKNILTEGVAI
jgi:predicted nucleotidyltransferase